jgi:anti-sigma factor RsiW
MNCRNCEQLLSAYLDNELGGDQMLKLRGHLAECNCCREELEQLRELKAMLASVPSIEPRAGFEERLSARVFEIPVQRSNRLAWAAVSLAAAACVFAILSTQFTKPDTSSQNLVSNSQTTLQEDQALAAAGDPLSGQPPMVNTVSYGDR